MTREGKKLKGRKVDNPMKWMEEDKSHFEIKKELQKFLSENDYILNLVGAENESALLLVAEHFANWNRMQNVKEELTGGERLERLQPSLPSDLDEAAEEYAKNRAKDPEQCYEYLYWELIDAVRFGAEWMAGQGYSKTEGVFSFNGLSDFSSVVPMISLPKEFEPGDKVRIQITKVE